MKPPKDLRPLTDVRVTRKTNVELAHGDSHGWAVSYADLLMVLLSFFVLYFSFAEENPNTVNQELHKIALAMRGEKPVDAQRAGRKPDTVTDLAELMKMEGVTVTDKGDHIVIDLLASAYGPGQYRIQKELRAQVNMVVEKLLPYKEKVALTVIGHADSKVMVRRNEYLQDNFDLSSIRALSVLKYVVQKGFPENKATARAASSFDRAARSISFEVRLAAAPAPGGAQ
ncbi:MAG TPA: OmpA family protein [Bdellovibrionales bacterium]|nr:OmpA family protein [Bdellovibrionales bacterium]